MSTPAHPVAVLATDIPPSKPSTYPQAFQQRFAGRQRRALASAFGLQQFGVTLMRLAPGAGATALRHAHSKQEEFVYVLQGRPTLYTDQGPMQLQPGMCAGFRTGAAHDLVNETGEEVVYLEVGDRSAGDQVDYPGEDLKAVPVEGKYLFTHRDGTPY